MICNNRANDTLPRGDAISVKSNKSHAAPWWVTASMPTGQTGRRKDARPLYYAFR